MLGYISTNNPEVSNTSLDTLSYLLGEFNVLVYTYQANFWAKVGSGVSSIISTNKLVTEKIELMKGTELVTMNNTFGRESSENYKMLTLDLTSGTMEVYKGKILGEKLILSNSETARGSDELLDESYIFKLIYTQQSEKENQVVIGRSKDRGKTWIPYIKSIYVRK